MAVREVKLSCVCCKETEDALGAFWTLKNYFGLSGVYCAKCYTKVSHDGYGRPKHPEEYIMILLKQENKDGNA